MLFEYQLGGVRVGVRMVRLERRGGQAAQGFEEAFGVEPADPDEGGIFHIFEAPPRAIPIDHLRFVQSNDAFRERVVVVSCFS